MALLLTPQCARLAAHLLSPSACLYAGWATCSNSLFAQAPQKTHENMAPHNPCRAAMRRGAQQGAKAGYGAAAALSFGAFTAHVLLPRSLLRYVPMPRLSQVLVQGLGGTTVHELGLKALDWAAQMQHRRMQLLVLGTLGVTALMTEGVRFRCAVVWVGLPAMGAVLGAAIALVGFGAERPYGWCVGVLKGRPALAKVWA